MIKGCNMIMKKYMFLDTETNGLEWGADLLQLAYIVTDEHGEIKDKFSAYVYLNG